MTKPVPFHGFIGQRRAVQLVRAQAEGAKAAGRPFPHTLLMGQSGLGKTELATAIAAEMEAKVQQIVATGGPDELLVLRDVRSHDIIFIDEAHALALQTQELLFPYLDAAANPAVGSECDLPVCTFLIATDQPGRLAKALHRRIPIQIMFSPYIEEEMIDIIARIASAHGLAMSPQARRLLARSSQGNPRVARHRVQCLSTYAQVAVSKSVDRPTLQAFLDVHGVDAWNRTEGQNAYLHGLHRIGGTGSLETVASQIGTDATYLERHIEPFLLSQGWITKSSRGRSLTRQGVESLSGSGPTEPMSVDATDASGEPDSSESPAPDAGHPTESTSSVPPIILESSS